MLIEALLIWLGMSIAFAAGYVCRALMESVDTGGDIDDRLKDYSDEYGGNTKPPVKEEGTVIAAPKRAFLSPRKPCPPKPRILSEWGAGLFLIPLVLLMTSCMPKVEHVMVTERPCELAPLDPKPPLPAVTYVDRGKLLCLNVENQMRALEREVRLREYGNYCEAAYKAAVERCSEVDR